MLHCPVCRHLEPSHGKRGCMALHDGTDAPAGVGCSCIASPCDLLAWRVDDDNAAQIARNARAMLTHPCRGPRCLFPWHTASQRDGWSAR